MIRLNDYSDKKLIHKALRGEEVSYKFMLDKYYPFVQSTVRKFIKNDQDTEEIIQDVFVKVFKKLPNFNHASKFSTWVYTIAKRTSLNHLENQNRKQKLRRELDVTLTPSNKLKVLPIAYRNMDIAHVHKMIESLPPRYSNVLTMFYLEDHDINYISKTTGLSNGTVKMRLFRARKKLREKLETFTARNSSALVVKVV